MTSIPAAACERCARPREDPALRQLCAGCLAAFQETLVAMQWHAGQPGTPGHLATLPADGSYVLIADLPGLEAAERHFAFEILGRLVPVAALPPSARLAWPTPAATCLAIEPWQCRFYLDGGPIYLERLWRPGPGFHPVTIGGMRTTKLSARDVRALHHGAELFDLTTHPGGAPPGPRPLSDTARRKLAEARRQKGREPGLSRRELAKRLGVREQTLRTWEKQERAHAGA